MDKKTEKLFQKELKIPCHINHIAERILKVSKTDAQEIIDLLIQDGIVEESGFAKKYYKLKDNV
jgi:hypothetical protein